MNFFHLVLLPAAPRNIHEEGESYSARALHQSVGRESQLSVFKVLKHLTAAVYTSWTLFFEHCQQQKAKSEDKKQNAAGQGRGFRRILR